ncbi:MAG: iron chaperone [Candidatus Nanopelagicales bacterium]
MVKNPQTVDGYIADFPVDVQDILQRLRSTVVEAVPGSTETIRYGMPAAMLDGHYVIHYAAWKKHIGLYPVPLFEGPLEQELAPLRASKDTIHLRYSEPIQYDLVARLVAALVQRRTTSDT